MDNIDKVFYTAGDVVQIKHPLPCKPIMLVKGKETKTIKGEGNHFLGIKCFWFTFQGEYQENIFSTKDLEHYKGPDYSKAVPKAKHSIEWSDDVPNAQ